MPLVHGDRKSYVYVLIDPRDKSWRYIGITTQSPATRLVRHVWESRNIRTRCHRVYWVRALDRLGLTPEVKTLCVTSNDHAKRTEVALIATLRSKGYRLTNMTDGGDGSLGVVITQDMRRAISARNKGRISPLRGVPKGKPSWNKGKPCLEHVKLAVSRANTGRPSAQKGKPSRLRGTRLSDETRRKMSVGIRASWARRRLCQQNP